MPHPVPCPTIIQTAESILRIESSKWIYHERALAKSLGLSTDQLRSFMHSIGRSGGAPPPYNVAIDLDSGDENMLNLHRMQHGSFSTSENKIHLDEPSLTHTVNGMSNYYQIGRKEARDKRITMNFQKELIRIVIGTHSLLDKYGEEYKNRRQQCWRDWIDGSNPITSALYDRDHLPFIALHYRKFWNVTIPPSIPVMEIPTAVLELVKKEIVDLFVKMFIIPSSALEQFTVLRRSTRNS